MPEISTGTQEEKDSFQSVQSVEITTQIMVHAKWTSGTAPSLMRSKGEGQMVRHQAQKVEIMLFICIYIRDIYLCDIYLCDIYLCDIYIYICDI